MNRREHLEKAKFLREYVRKARTDFFVPIQIETAVALARTAEILHDRGSKKNALRALALAWEAYTRAVKRLNSDETEARDNELRARLLEARTILEELPTPPTYPPRGIESQPWHGAIATAMAATSSVTPPRVTRGW
jgi:hypothetical protein